MDYIVLSTSGWQGDGWQVAGFCDSLKQAENLRRLRSDYAWYSMDSTNEYTREYAQGYRFAFEVSCGVEE
jgi:hypothetical protein